MPVDRRLKIIVAEDDPNVREMVALRLSTAGYLVSTARDGADAMRRTLDLRPHALVLDINMPGMDGFAVLDSLRSHRCQTKVLVMTARHAAEDVKRAVSLGAKDYLAKPFNDAQLLARVGRMLRPAPKLPIAVVMAPSDSMVLD